jgi:hypothetical protein
MPTQLSLQTFIFISKLAETIKAKQKLQHTLFLVSYMFIRLPHQSPTLGAHTHAHAHAHGFWVGMGAMLLFMGGHGRDIIVHGWASVLCIPVSSSKLESNFSDARNTLTKKRSGLKSSTVNDLLFVRSNQDLV